MIENMDTKSYSISITPKTILTVLLIIASAFLLWTVKGTVLVVLLAVVIASFIDGGVRFFQRFHIPRTLAVTIMYVTGILVLVGFLYLFIPVLLDELLALLQLLPPDSPIAQFINPEDDGGFMGALGQLTDTTNANPFELVQMLRSELSALNILETLSIFFGGVVNIILVAVISFYLSVLDDGVGQFLRIVTPLQHEEHVLSIWERSRAKIAGWFRGQVLLALIEGVLTYVGLLIIGVPYALIIGIVAFFMSLIPYGVLLSGFVAVVVGFFAGGIPMALTTFIFILILQQLENYVWQPLIINSVTGVPSLIIIISLVIGAQLAGLMGLLLAVPIAVVILEIIHDAERRRLAYNRDDEMQSNEAPEEI